MRSFSNWIIFSLLLTACAHDRAIDRKLEAELAEEPAIATGGPAALESRKLIEESSNLTQLQKEKLLALHSRMAGEMAMYRSELGKLKMLFFKTLLNPNSSDAEISNLKSRILSMDRRKTNDMLRSAEAAREILGRRSLEDERVLRAFSFEHIGRPGELGW